MHPDSNATNVKENADAAVIAISVFFYSKTEKLKIIPDTPLVSEMENIRVKQL